MKHATIEDLQNVALVNTEPKRPLTAVERLNRWADLLERRGTERLSTLAETEYQPSAARARMQAPNSALSVAFADPLLRSDGLTDETYGAAKRYFGLSDWQLHEVICHCHLGETTSGTATARRIRALAARRPNLMDWARRFFPRSGAQ